MYNKTSNNLEHTRMCTRAQECNYIDNTEKPSELVQQKKEDNGYTASQKDV